MSKLKSLLDQFIAGISALPISQIVAKIKFGTVRYDFPSLGLGSRVVEDSTIAPPYTQSL